MMLLFDEKGLLPLAILCGATITAVRTAAVTALATDVLARPQARVLAILGAGEQAHAHVKALRLVREFEDIRIWSHRAAELPGFLAQHPGLPLRACASVAEAVQGADVVCTLTSSRSPILGGDLLQPGMHVNLVGASSADCAEADDELVRRSRFFVDWRESTLHQAGELLGAIERGVVGPEHIQAELGEVLAGSKAGRRAEHEITVYKSLGIAAQDLMTARRVFDLAEARGLGQLVQL